MQQEERTCKKKTINKTHHERQLDSKRSEYGVSEKQHESGIMEEQEGERERERARARDE